MSELKVDQQNSEEVLEDISINLKGPIRIIGSLTQILSNHIEHQDFTMVSEIIPRIATNVKNLCKLFKSMEKSHQDLLSKNK